MTQRRPRSKASRDRSHSVVSATHQLKVDRARQLAHITRALNATPIDIHQLRAISTHSFLTTAFRQQIWPLLLGLPSNPLTLSFPSIVSSGVVVLPASSYPAVREHAYYSQVEKDIARSLHHFDVCRGWKQHHRSVKRAQLARIIHTIFSLHSDLHYIQGYHDIIAVLLLTLSDEYTTYQAAEHLSLMHIRDSLHPTLDTVVSSLSLIFPLLKLVDEPLWQLLIDSGVQSFFTLSWVLTWFAHTWTALRSFSTTSTSFYRPIHPCPSTWSSLSSSLNVPHYSHSVHRHRPTSRWTRRPCMHCSRH